MAKKSGAIFPTVLLSWPCPASSCLACRASFPLWLGTEYHKLLEEIKGFFPSGRDLSSSGLVSPKTPHQSQNSLGLFPHLENTDGQGRTKGSGDFLQAGG